MNTDSAIFLRANIEPQFIQKKSPELDPKFRMCIRKNALNWGPWSIFRDCKVSAAYAKNCFKNFHSASKEVPNGFSDPAIFNEIQNIHNSEENKRVNTVGEAKKRLMDEIKKHVDPIDFHFCGREMLIKFLTNKVEKYQINNPGNKEFLDKWNKFKISLAVKYNNKASGLSSKTKEYLIYLRDELTKIGSEGSEEELNKENKLWEIFALLFADSTQLDFLVSLHAQINLLENDSSSTENMEGFYMKLHTHTQYLLDSNHQFVNRLLKDLPWVLDVCEKKLEPYIHLDQHETMNCAKKLYDEIGAMKKKWPPLIQQLYVKDLSDLSDKKSEISNELITLFNSWTPTKAYFDSNSFFSALTKHENIFITCFEDDKKKIKTKFNEDKVGNVSFGSSLIYDYLKIHFGEIKKLKTKEENVQTNSLKERLSTPENIKWVKDSLGFHKELKQCASLLFIYFQSPILDLIEVNQNLQLFCQKNTNLINKIFKKNLPEESRSLEECLELINGTNNTLQTTQTSTPNKTSAIAQRAKKKHRIAHQRFKKEITLRDNVFQNSLIPYTSTSSTDVEIKLETPISLYQQLSSHLSNLVQKSIDSDLKNACRQALMYLEDYQLALTFFTKAKNHVSQLFYLTTVIQSAYFYAEQMLNYAALVNGVPIADLGNRHNLLDLARTANLSEKKDLEALFLANYWTRAPQEQFQNRKESNKPPLLHFIKTIYEVKDLANSNLHTTIEKIKESCLKTIEYSKTLPFCKKLEEKVLINARQIETHSPHLFQSSIKIDLNTCQEIARRCHALIPRISPLWDAKLNQIIGHLKLLEGLLQELSQENIDSSHLSLLVRNFFYWENTILEEFLQLSYGIQSGINTHSHDIADLYRKALVPSKLTPSAKKDLKFLSEELPNLHNISRYPFNTKKEENNFTHNTILQAELLREDYTLGLSVDPFILVGNKTGLNYREVSLNNIAPQKIISNLNETHKKIFNIIRKILPTIGKI